MSYFGEYSGGSAASGFIARMMAENRVKHKGAYGPNGVLPKGTHMDGPRNFDLNRLANRKQKPFRGKNTSKYGASPFILEHFSKGKTPTKAKGQRTKVPDAPFKLVRKPKAPKTAEVEEVIEEVKVSPKSPKKMPKGPVPYGFDSHEAYERRQKQLADKAKEYASKGYVERNGLWYLPKTGKGLAGGAKWEWTDGRDNVFTKEQIERMYELSLVDLPFEEMEEGDDYEKLKDGRYRLRGWEKTALDVDDMADALNSGAYELENLHIVFDEYSGLYFIKEEMGDKDLLKEEELKAIPAEEWIRDYEPEEDMKERASTPSSDKSGEGRFRGGAAQTYDGPVYRNMDGSLTDDQGNSVYQGSDGSIYYGDSSTTSSSVPAYHPAPTYDPTTYDTPQQQYVPSRTGPGYTEPAYDSAGNIVHELYDQYENAKKVYDVATGMYELAEGSASGLASQAAGEALGPVYNVATGLYELAEAGSVAEFGTAALSLAGEVLPYLLIGLGNKGKKKAIKGGAEYKSTMDLPADWKPGDKVVFNTDAIAENDATLEALRASNDHPNWTIDENEDAYYNGEYQGSWVKNVGQIENNLPPGAHVPTAEEKEYEIQRAKEQEEQKKQWNAYYAELRRNRPQEAKQIVSERKQGVYNDGDTGPVYDSNGNVLDTIWDAATAAYKVFSVGRGIYTLAMATTPVGAAVAAFSLGSTILPGLLGWSTPNRFLGFGDHKGKRGGKKIPEAFAKGMAFAHAYAKSHK